MKASVLLAACTSLAAFAMANVCVAQVPDCATLDAVIQAANDGFRPVMVLDEDGEPDGRASVYLPDAHDCRVSETSYICRYQTLARADTRAWDGSNIAYLSEQFRRWAAGCASYQGDARFFGTRGFVYRNFPGRYRLQILSDPSSSGFGVRISVE